MSSYIAVPFGKEVWVVLPSPFSRGRFDAWVNRDVAASPVVSWEGSWLVSGGDMPSGGDQVPLLTVTVDRPRTEVAVCTAAGEVDLATAPRLEGRLREAIDNGSCHVVLDVSAVTFFAAAGVTALEHTRERVREGYSMVLVGQSRPVVRVLDLLGLDRSLPRYDDVDTAVKVLAGE